MENKIRTGHKAYGIYERYIKRTLDVLCVILTLALFWWLYAVIALLVRIKLGAPVLFAQPRVGKDEKIFRLYKFRSMTNETDANGQLLPDEHRLTRFGKLLRSTSLDELPELFNILRGEMSFVGPRPLLVKYLPYYTDMERRRHEVLPGLTGFAQVNGRNAVPWENKFEMDIEYVDHISFLLDMKIVMKTIYKVIKRENITMDKNRPVKRLSVIMDERAKMMETQENSIK